ncbi:MAG: alpha/beta fold hydrolase [Anaerolineales bacterium]|nr:alpha/beta fold hydrolase [Anaerolineales bacterium]
MPQRSLKSWKYWRNLLLFTFVVLLIVSFGLCAYIARTRAIALVHPTRTTALRTPLDVGLEDWEDVSFLSEDGLLIYGWFIPSGREGASATLIFVHGLGSNREGLLEQANLLHDHGYNALLLDLRNHGESEGLLTTLGYLEVHDIEGGIDYLLDRPDVDPERIGLVGHSMGGATVIRAAAHSPQVKATVAESAYASIEDNISQGVREILGLPPFPFAPLVVWFGELEAGADIHSVRPIDDLDQISPRAIMFIHGEQDELVVPDNSIRLYEAATEPKSLYLIPDAGHGGLMSADPDEFERQIVSFLDEYLK